jgi:hypothetical protein
MREGKSTYGTKIANGKAKYLAAVTAAAAAAARSNSGDEAMFNMNGCPWQRRRDGQQGSSHG